MADQSPDKRPLDEHDRRSAITWLETTGNWPLTCSNCGGRDWEIAFALPASDELFALVLTCQASGCGAEQCFSELRHEAT